RELEEIRHRHLELEAVFSGPAAARGAARFRDSRPARSTAAGTTAGSHVERLCAELETVLSGITLLRELSERSLDAVAAFGELLSAPIVARALASRGTRAVAVDARRILRTDDRHGRANADLAQTRREARRFLLPILTRGSIPVVTGFIAR